MVDFGQTLSVLVIEDCPRIRGHLEKKFAWDGAHPFTATADEFDARTALEGDGLSDPPHIVFLDKGLTEGGDEGWGILREINERKLIQHPDQHPATVAPLVVAISRSPFASIDGIHDPIMPTSPHTHFDGVAMDLTKPGAHQIQCPRQFISTLRETVGLIAQRSSVSFNPAPRAVEAHP